MKKTLLALTLMGAAAANAAWEPVQYTNNRSMMFTYNGHSSEGSYIAATLFAMSSDCSLRLDLTMVAATDDWDAEAVEISRPVQIKIDRGEGWSFANLVGTYEVEDGNAFGIFGINLNDEGQFLSQLTQGKVLRWRIRGGEDASWSAPLAVSLEGSGRRVRELLKECESQRDPWSMNQSEYEWES